MSAACGYSVKITIEICTNGATTLSRMNSSGYIGHVTILSLMFTVACCLMVGLEIELGLDVVFGWMAVMHTCLYYFRLSLSHCHGNEYTSSVHTNNLKTKKRERKTNT